jgi:hypothetical protein
MNQSLTLSHPVDQTSLPAGFEAARVWRGTAGSSGSRNYAEYFAFFNLDDKPVTLKATWKQLGLDDKKHQAQDLWSDTTIKESKEIDVTLPPHGSKIYQVR